MHSLKRCAGALALALGLASSSDAQILPFQAGPHHGYNVIDGGPGSDVSVGTDGNDTIRDGGGPDQDSQHDAPGGPDGEHDELSTFDGDNMDVMYGGPEDDFVGDPGDRVVILKPNRPPGSKPILWQGTFAEYHRMRALIRWIQDRVQHLLAGGGPFGGGLWLAALDQATDELVAVEPSGDPLIYVDYFSIGPYEPGEVPSTPGEFLLWCPYPLKSDPCEQTADLSMTLDEYASAISGALAVIDCAVEIASESDGDDDAE